MHYSARKVAQNVGGAALYRIEGGEAEARCEFALDAGRLHVRRGGLHGA
jgi:hypothetical protein